MSEQLYIVRVRGAEKYWEADSRGITHYREEAYRYTAKQLLEHTYRWEIENKDASVIPVKE